MPLAYLPIWGDSNNRNHNLHVGNDHDLFPSQNQDRYIGYAIEVPFTTKLLVSSPSTPPNLKIIASNYSTFHETNHHKATLYEYLNSNGWKKIERKTEDVISTNTILDFGTTTFSGADSIQYFKLRIEIPKIDPSGSPFSEIAIGDILFICSIIQGNSNFQVDLNFVAL